MQKSARFIVVAIPLLALTFAVPFVNRIEPRIFGLPFLLVWVTVWALITPVFLWTVGRIEHHW
jgi:hypothetical protein